MVRFHHLAQKNVLFMKLKPTDHIVIFIENNNGVEEFLSNGWAQVICKTAKSDYIFLVDSLENPDLNEIVNGIELKTSIFPTKLITFEKVKYEDGIDITRFKKTKYFKSDDAEVL